jgi:uncharacterized protein (DUF305 family)
MEKIRKEVLGIKARGKAAIGGAVTGLALLALTAGALPAQTVTPPSGGLSGQMGSMMGGDGMGSMMSMMGGGQMGSMMGGQAMGSFDEDKPFDLQFIDQMIMHHEGAIMSAENMIGDSERPELRELARNIEKSQSEQVEQMQAMRRDWYPGAERTFGMMDPTLMDEMMGDGAMRQMMGGSMQQVMDGDATDEMFLEMMIPHHQMAVDMSEQALKEAEHPELKKLAQKIKNEQSAEIKLMQDYLEEIDAANGV